MGNQQQFKHTTRTARIVETEETFTGGMQYVETPIQSDYAKLIVNYDLNDSGNVLTPRPGLRVTDVFNAKYIPLDVSEKHIELLSHHYNNKDLYTQLILGVDNVVEKANTEIFKGDAFSVALHNAGYTSEALEGKPHYTKSEQKTVHDWELDKPIINANIIGTSAWNNDFYYFSDITEDDKTSAKLCKSSFDPDSENKFVSEVLKPKQLEPTQVTNGYNMLADDPYDFVCSLSPAVGSTIALTGLLPYTKEENSKLNLKPRVGDAVIFNLFYNVASLDSKYTFVFEWSDPTSGIWNTFHTQTYGKMPYDEELGIPTPIKATLQGIPSSLIYVRASAYKRENYQELPYPDATVTYTLDLTSSVNISQFSDDLMNYDLANAKGLCYWANRLVCYGCKEDPTMLFVSDLNDPTYFPYPNNIDTFEEPIMYVAPYLNDKLLVFTKTKLYLLTLGEDYLSWTHALIQSNLNIAAEDYNCVQIVNNMVMFKSGNYYYMVVPKTTTTTGLTIAPVSNNIKNFFDNFKTSVANLLIDVYNYYSSVELIKYYNYLDFEAIHNVYMFKSKEGVIFNLDLIYNSNKRYWKVYVYESSGALTPYMDNATERGTLITPTIINGKGLFQVMAYSTDSNIKKDLYYSAINPEDSSAQIFKNYQLFNTGYRDISSNQKKRFRELQFEVNNTCQKPISFYTSFYIDGDPRRYCLKNSTSVHVDKDTGINYLVFAPDYDELMKYTLPEATMLDIWTLNESTFPDVYFWKVRIPVSGKGYTPQMQILSQNEEAYDILNISWVYRMMYSR